MPVALAVVGLVAAVGGTVLSMKAQKKAAKAARKQQKVESRRSRRQVLREAQIRRAQAAATAQGAGAVTGSAQGGIGSIVTQAGEQLGFGSQVGALSQIISKQQGKAALYSGIADLGQMAFSAGVSAGAFQKG